MQNVETTSVHLVKVKRNCTIGENVNQLPVAKTNSVVKCCIAIRILHRQNALTQWLSYTQTEHVRRAGWREANATGSYF